MVKYIGKSIPPFLISLSVWLLQTCVPLDQPSLEFILQSKIKDTTQLIHVHHDTLYAQSQLRQLYTFSGNQLIWRSYSSDPARLKKLIEIIEKVKNDGLNPYDYHLQRIYEYQRQFNSNHLRNPKHQSEIVNIDLLLSDAFLTLAFHHYTGRVHGVEMNSDWECYFDQKNLPSFLWKAIATDSIGEALLTLDPPYHQYTELRRMLEVSGQSLTTKQINKITSSMERWRWLPKLRDSLFLTVNIPAFRLKLHSHDSTLIDMKTIVGILEKPTPIFNCKISHIIVRPRWNVPTSILEEEILPRVSVDTLFFARNHFKILRTWQDNDTSFINPSSIIWDSVTAENFPYRIIQTSGFWNPLGDIKFMFPNQYEVYLHDTPNRSLFDQEVRMFSHGCIRIERAAELAALLSQNDSLRYPQLFRENERRDLNSFIPIFINYWTAWIENGKALFYSDIYGTDSLLQIEIRKSPQIF
ncbi:MAG: L,D-transpeptidase family protein [Cyclobacteriaceae bacterium]